MKLFLEGFKELDHVDLIRVNGGYTTTAGTDITTIPSSRTNPYAGFGSYSNTASTLNTSPTGYTQVGSSDTLSSGGFDSDIASMLNNGLNQPYVKGTNDCDAWLEACFAEAGVNLAATSWGSAAGNTVSEHVQNIGGLSSELGQGINIFVGNNQEHCGAILQNSDGSVTVWHCGSNSSTNFLGSATYTYPSLEAFESSTGWAVNGYYDPTK